MANAVELNIPCVELPKIPQIPSVNILGMFDMKAMLDFSLGTPSNCTLAINLLLQISPLLASMSCLLKILGVIKALGDFVSKLPPDPKELIKKIGEASTCFVALTPLNIAVTIKGILQLIISFLNCFLSQLESLIHFNVSIDLDAAQGNETLRLTLECAKKNGQTTMDNLMLSLGAVEPILGLINTLGSVAAINIKLPSLQSISAQKDTTQAIASLKEAITGIEDAINALPI